jgi:hypothetical protein
VAACPASRTRPGLPAITEGGEPNARFAPAPDPDLGEGPPHRGVGWGHHAGPGPVVAEVVGATLAIRIDGLEPDPHSAHAVLEIDPEDVEVVLLVAGADHESVATGVHGVDHRGVLDHLHRVVEGEQHHSGAEAEPTGVGEAVHRDELSVVDDTVTSGVRTVTAAFALVRHVEPELVGRTGLFEIAGEIPAAVARVVQRHNRRRERELHPTLLVSCSRSSLLMTLP